MFIVERHVGRFIEVRIETPIDVADVDVFRGALWAELKKLNGRKAVLATILTEAWILRPPVADAFVALMRLDNPVVERSGFLISSSATFGLQIERILREAQNPSRRAFRDACSIAEWLAEVLDKNEQRRMKELFQGL